jgi:proteasome lid subunit RPN8/RPN11
MLNSLVSTAHRWLDQANRSLFQKRFFSPAPSPEPPALKSCRRLEQLLLTDEVCRTLFREYSSHRAGARGDEEIGWVLLGIREDNQALALATLPAGARRQAGATHVQFNSSAQAVASCILRQDDKRLTTLGVMHTHPGNLNHPSEGDFLGDRLWISQLRGREGVFGIGTADAQRSNGSSVGHHPQPHVQTFGEAAVSWYALAEGDENYRPLQVQLTLGPDLAVPLHGVWATLEAFAEPLSRLYRQQRGMTIQVANEPSDPALAVNIALVEPEQALRVVLQGEHAAYYLQRGQELLTVEAPAKQLDHAVYLILAAIAEQSW